MSSKLLPIVALYSLSCCVANALVLRRCMRSSAPAPERHGRQEEGCVRSSDVVRELEKLIPTSPEHTYDENYAISSSDDEEPQPRLLAPKAAATSTPLAHHITQKPLGVTATRRIFAAYRRLPAKDMLSVSQDAAQMIGEVRVARAARLQAHMVQRRLLLLSQRQQEEGQAERHDGTGRRVRSASFSGL